MAVHVLTNRYNNARTGANMAEKLLDTENVAVTTFGKLFTGRLTATCTPSRWSSRT